MVIKYEKIEQKKPFPWVIAIIIILVALVGLGAGYAFFGSHQAPVIVNNSTPAPAPINNTVIVQQKQVTQSPAVVPDGIITPHQSNYVIINAGAPAGLELYSTLNGNVYDVVAYYKDGNTVTSVVEGTAQVDAHTGQIISSNI